MQEVFLNLLPNGVPPVCYISQYDGTSRVIRFRLLNGTEPLTLNGSETITLNFRKPDREEVTLAIENTSSNYIDLVISSELSEKYGEGFGEFRIQGLGTLSFKMYIESDAYGDSLKTRSVSGPIATFETDLAEDLIKLDVDLEPIQDLHGYDGAWPAGGGKNILGNFYDWAAWSPTLAAYGDCPTSNSNRGLLLNTKPNTTYTISIELFPNLEQVPKYLYVASANGTDVSTRLAYITNGATLVSATFTFTTTATDIYYLRINTSYINSQATFDTEIGNKVKWIQLEVGSTATAWAPYSNICPISGHDSAQLFRTGKNLYDNRVESIVGYITSSSFSTSSLKARSFYIPIVGGLTYTVQKMVSARFSIATSPYIPTNGAAFTNRTQNNARTSLTITAGANDKYLWVFFYLYDTDTENESVVKDTIQIEVGSTATNYEPYVSDPTPITVQFGQTIYKGKLDSARRKIIVYFTARAIKTFPWTYNDTEYDFGYFATGNTVDKAYNTNFICECFKSIDKARGSLKNGELAVYNLTNAARRFTVRYDAISTVEALLEQFGDYLICYELAEPIEIDLTQVQTASIDSTPVASFETTLARPLETSEHYFSCSQAEGTPTPDSPIPITGVSEITAIRTGKNICPLFIANSGNGLTTTVNPDGTIHVTGTATGSGGFITSSNVLGCAIPSGQQITISISNTIPGRLRQFLAGVGRDSSSDINAGERSTTFSRDFEIASIRLYLFTTAGQSYDFSFKFQIELGSTATEYEPYSGESITVSLGGTYYGGKLVQSEDGSRKIVLSHKKLTFDGSSDESWNDYPTGNGFFINGINDHISESYGDGFSSTLPVSRSVSNLGIVFGINSKYIFLMQVKTSWNISTVSDLRTFLSNNPMDVVYKLETPIEVSLPDGDPLNAVVGENNVYCNTGDTALTYYFNMVADPIQIPALVGTNNVYSDAGDVDVEYYTTLEGGNG